MQARFALDPRQLLLKLPQQFPQKQLQQVRARLGLSEGAGGAGGTILAAQLCPVLQVGLMLLMEKKGKQVLLLVKKKGLLLLLIVERCTLQNKNDISSIQSTCFLMTDLMS